MKTRQLILEKAACFFRARYHLLGIVLLLLCGGWLRLYHLNWDEGLHLHPDERFLTMVAAAIHWPHSIVEYFDSANSPLNPYNQGFRSYVYGTLPLFLVRGVASLIGWTDYGHVYLVGRAVSAIADTGTLLLVFVLATYLYNRRVGLLSATLYAFSVLPIQQAHFFTVDSLAGLFIALALLGAVLICRGRYSGSWLLGLGYGLACSCRINLFPFALILLVTWALVWRSGRKNFLGALVGLFFTFALALVAFRLCQPYAFVGLAHIAPNWWRDMQYIHELSLGAIDWPPGLQWAGRLPFVFPYLNTVRWGMGWPLGLTATAAVIWLIYRRRWTEPVTILWLWIVTLFIFVSAHYVVTMRYYLPIYAACAVVAGAFLEVVWGRGLMFPKWRDARSASLHAGAKDNVFSLFKSLVRRTVVIAVLLGTVLWALAFVAIYQQSHPRIAASSWIYANIPRGKTLVSEHWDDALPLPIAGRWVAHLYDMVELPWYDPDRPEKLEKVLLVLENSDFLILSSNRLYDSIPRLARRYPMTKRYYESLFDGSLGFNRVAEFVSYPKLFGWGMPDQRAEEAFTVYDHPRVLIFQKTAAWSVAKARSLLAVDWSTVGDFRAREVNRGLGLGVADWPVVKKSGTWSRVLDAKIGIFASASWWRHCPVLSWWLVVELLGLLVFPLVSMACRRLPDRGWLLSKMLGPLLVAYGGWLLASWRIVPLRSVTLWGMAVVLGLVSLSLLVRQGYRRSLAAFFRERWLLLVTEEFLFLVIWEVFLLIRAGNPDLWHPWMGGEKPMDFAYLNAIVRSDYFPPYNPWFAGEYINYYYWGFVLVAALIKMTGVLPAVAYNLAVPLFAAWTAVGAFCAGGSLAALALRRRRWPRAYLYAGFVAMVLASFCGNLSEWRLIFHPPEVTTAWYWAASRAIHVPIKEVTPITEFPFFTFLYGDLHAHAMALPFTMAVLALAIALLRRWSWWTIWGLALVTGALYPLNAWDYPTYTLVAIAALLLFRGRAMSERLVALATIVVVGWLAFLPFYEHFQSIYGGFVRWTGTRSSLVDLLLIHGSAVLLLGMAAWRQVVKRRFYWFLVALALALIVFVELFALRGDIGRMNTVFKFYLQVWMLFSVTAGVGAALLWMRAKTVRALWFRLVIVLVLLAQLVYPLLAVPARWRDRFSPWPRWSLNGEAFMRQAVYSEGGQKMALVDDKLALDWLRWGVTGTPVVLEAQAPEYHWGGRVSIYTGLPTVMGWSWHERQQRGESAEVYKRIADVRRIYSETNSAVVLPLIRKYGVDYVVVGQLERALYPAAGLEKFSEGKYWQGVYTNGGCQIYRWIGM